MEYFFQSRNLSQLEVMEGRKARPLPSLRESIIWGALLWSVPSSSPARTTNRLQIATVVSLLYGLSSQKIIWQPILLSFFLLLLFVTTEIYVAQDPIIPVTVLKSRGVLLACVAQLGIMVARWMVLFYTPYVSFSLFFFRFLVPYHFRSPGAFNISSLYLNGYKALFSISRSYKTRMLTRNI